MSREDPLAQRLAQTQSSRVERSPFVSTSTLGEDPADTIIDEEGSEDYCKGGHHPVHVGEIYNNGESH